MRKAKSLLPGSPPSTAYRIDPPKGLTVRDGQLDDLSGIIKIVNSKNNRLSFGWVQKIVLADAVKHQNEEGEKSQHRLRVVQDADGRIVAFLRAYHRNDGTTTLHEIGVAEDKQSAGIGTYLLMELIHASQKRNMQKIGLKTPVGMRSNDWYPTFGFKHVGTFEGRKRVLNCYELEL